MMIARVQRRLLKASIGRVICICLVARWSCPTVLFMYLLCRSKIRVPASARALGMVAVLAPLSSMVTGKSCRSIARSKEHRAAARSCLAVSRNPTVWPSRSTVRYRYFQAPRTSTYVSPAHQLPPNGRLRWRKAAASIGKILTVKRLMVVINKHSASGHRFLDVARAQRVGCVPEHAHQHHLRRVAQPLGCFTHASLMDLPVVSDRPTF